MKFSTSIFVSGLAALAQAQSACNSLTSAIPTCGTSCINSAGSAVGCAITDYACQCSSSNYAAIQSAAETCVLSACGASAGAVLVAANSICSCAATAASAAAMTSSGPVSSSSSSAAPGSISSSSPSAAATSSSAPTTTSSPTPLSTTGSLPANTSTPAPVTGGQSMLQPWIVAELSVLAIFGGLLAVL